jgi:hypothetical protein
MKILKGCMIRENNLISLHFFDLIVKKGYSEERPTLKQNQQTAEQYPKLIVRNEYCYYNVN